MRSWEKYVFNNAYMTNLSKSHNNTIESHNNAAPDRASSTSDHVACVVMNADFSQELLSILSSTNTKQFKIELSILSSCLS